MKTITRKFWMPLLALAALGLGSAMTAHAQFDDIQPQITTIGCSATGTLAVTVRGAQFTGTTSAPVDNFTALATDNRTFVDYTPAFLDVSSDIPGLGTITTSLGAGSPVSSTRSISPAGGFPVRSSMSFNAVGTLNGTRYTSATAVTLVAPSANSFNPFVGEPFSLEAPVDFVDGEGNVGFTLDRLDLKFD